MNDNSENIPTQDSSANTVRADKPEVYPLFDLLIPREQKEKLLHQHALVIWFTGLSGSGKTTLALALEKKLFDMGYLSQLLDGDNIRTGICNNLGFSPDDRTENIRRIAEVAKLFIDCGIITLCSFVSPTREIRNMVKAIVGKENFLEIYVSTPVEVCEQRDVKGLYAKARAGLITDFTGINAPFEKPLHAHLTIDTTNGNLQEHADMLLNYILPSVQKK
jgi:adenylylsulfate kinase